MSNKPLTVGMVGESIAALQQALSALGLSIPEAENKRRFFGPRRGRRFASAKGVTGWSQRQSRRSYRRGAVGQSTYRLTPRSRCTPEARHGGTGRVAFSKTDLGNRQDRTKPDAPGAPPLTRSGRDLDREAADRLDEIGNTSAIDTPAGRSSLVRRRPPVRNSTGYPLSRRSWAPLPSRLHRSRPLTARIRPGPPTRRCLSPRGPRWARPAPCLCCASPSIKFDRSAICRTTWLRDLVKRGSPHPTIRDWPMPAQHNQSTSMPTGFNGSLISAPRARSTRGGPSAMVE